MTDSQKYFIHLLSSHLNNTIPTPVDKPNWKELFQLGELHNLTGMLCLAIKSLPIEYQPKKAMTYFKQALGQTLQAYELKQDTINKMIDLLNSNNINHLFVKGAAIRDKYPVPAVRTSGDTDITVSEEDFITAGELLKNNGFEVIQETNIQYVLEYNNNEIELKRYIDHIAGLSNNKYNNLFKHTENISGNTYILEPEYHLYYIIAHLLSHLKGGGAGIRQLMDVHIMISQYNINFNTLMSYCEEYGIDKSVKAIIAFSNRYFGTKCPDNYIIDDELFEHLSDIIINGGVFGYANGNGGMVRLASTDRISPVKAFMGLFKVSRTYLYRCYKYADKCHILLPIAYMNRIFNAVFKRGKENAQNIKTMFGDKSQAIKLKQLINELEI